MHKEEMTEEKQQKLLKLANVYSSQICKSLLKKHHENNADDLFLILNAILFAFSKIIIAYGLNAQAKEILDMFIPTCLSLIEENKHILSSNNDPA